MKEPEGKVKPDKNMPLREYIATAALEGMLAGNGSAMLNYEDHLAQSAVRYADALIEALQKE